MEPDTKTVTKMPRHFYEIEEGVSHTMLQDFVRGKPKPKTRALLIGSALHKRMEGGEAFSNEYEVIPDINLTTTEGKKILADAEEATGKIALRKSECDLVKSMFSAVAKHGIGRAYIESQGEREVAIFARIGHKDSKVLPDHPTVMKGIVDLLSTCAWDLKTTGWQNRDEFKNNIVNYGYDAQAALYRELVAAARDGEYILFHWLCVSKTAPHDVWVETPTPYMMSTGLRWIHTCLSLYERENNGKTRSC